MRMPGPMRWPGKIPAGRTTDALCSTMDLLPTFAKLAETPLPPRAIDGHDIRPRALRRAGAQGRRGTRKGSRTVKGWSSCKPFGRASGNSAC